MFVSAGFFVLGPVRPAGVSLASAWRMKREMLSPSYTTR
ncbi:MAG: DUF4113 domain-containing protein [Pseudomonadaceae bacterium]|nr:DUF4113 domain-containing protein [Pseudomonadaceae bacterium]